MGKFKEMDLLRQEREAFDADYPMEPTPRADMWIAWNSEDGFTFWNSEYAARLCTATNSVEWPVQYVMQKCTPLSTFVRSSEEDKAEVMERVIDKAIEAQKKVQPAPYMAGGPLDGLIGYTPPAAQPAPVQEPVAWMDASGNIYQHELWPDWNPPHTPLYVTPPAAQPAAWVGLTDEQIAIIYKAWQAVGADIRGLFWGDFVREITLYEAARGITEGGERG
jgi:hypothetical protein